MVAAVHSLDAKRASQAPVSIDPVVARLVGDVARPVTAPPIARGLDHFPGFKSGRIAGIAWLTDYMRRGADAVADYEPRHTYTPLGMVSGDVRLAIERV